MNWNKDAAPGRQRDSVPAAVVLQADFKVTGMRDLEIKMTMANHGSESAYVFDRLWTLESASRPVADAEPSYRFIRDGRLQLVLGPCPLPRLRNVTFRNIPHVTVLAAGSELKRTLALSGPIKEYSFYFPEPSDSGYDQVHVTTVQVVVQYVVARYPLAIEPSRVIPSAMEVVTPGALDGLRTVIVTSPKVELDALRRNDEFDRLTLPGEQPEPLHLR